jgi:hypothetical protein
MGTAHFGSRQPESPDNAVFRERRVNGDDLARDLLSLYEQLLAARLELIDGAGPAEGQVNLSRGELDCVVAQIDSAIVATRHIVSSTVRTPQDAARVFAIGSSRRARATADATRLSPRAEESP